MPDAYGVQIRSVPADVRVSATGGFDGEERTVSTGITYQVSVAGEASEGLWPAREEPATDLLRRRGQARSKRSRFMTLSHAATKSPTNRSAPSSEP